MQTPRHSVPAFRLAAAFALPWIAISACGGGGPIAPVEETADSTGDEIEVSPSACEGFTRMTSAWPEFSAPEDPLRCAEFSSPPLAPLPTAASCRALAAEERAECTNRVRARARIRRPLAEARAAASASNWPEAIAKLEAALVIADGEPDVLAELGWGRFRAREWCAASQDLPALEAQQGNPSDGAAPLPLVTLCTRQVSLHQAVEELTLAADAAPSLELRATWEHQRAQVSLALGERAEAWDALRRSLCTREDPTVREQAAALLWSQGDGTATNTSPELTIAFYRQASVLAPTPEREAFVRDVLAAVQQRFEVRPAPPVPLQSFFPTVEALCHALVLRDLSEPVDPSELPEDLCSAGDWDEVGLLRQGVLALQFHTSVLTVRNPEVYDGTVQTHYLIARSSQGVNVLLVLGLEHGDSRRHNAFVGAPEISQHPDIPDAPLMVVWDAGDAEAWDCNWQSRASTTAAFCGMVDATPRCFATVDLGPADYVSDTMLPTIQESLGSCDDGDYRSPPRHPSEFRPRFGLQATARELAVSREGDGAMLCLPLHETLSPLRQPIADQ